MNTGKDAVGVRPRAQQDAAPSKRTPQPQTEALRLVLSEIEQAEGYIIPLSALPQNGGISAEITGSERKGRNLSLQHGSTDLTVLFLCKDKDQQTAYEKLCKIGNLLDRMKPVEGETVQVTGAGVRSGTGLVGKEGDFYIYSMIARIGIYF